MFKLGSEGLQCIVDSLGLCLREVSISLNFPIDVLELRLELLLRLDTLHKHDVVVLIHFFELAVHLFEGFVVVLLLEEVGLVLGR